ncbi:MAG TPA: NAD(P)/FAD-dependent oxidoreductase [Bacteroidetes bacterium]|nr:NAD(P)/FAD-dependent oxidoreductase [Bacteroidota bacterium]
MKTAEHNQKKCVIIGGGAAGFFAAIQCAEIGDGMDVRILERAGKVLAKVKISGGGRCNLCHAAYDPSELVKAYPRGEKALLGPFYQFCSGDTVAWFAERGVETKTESDGRMFPVTDSSQTIIDCLEGAAEAAGVVVTRHCNVNGLAQEADGKWRVNTEDGQCFVADQVLVAPGSSQKLWAALADLGHTIVSPVPSLFTFNVKDERLKDLPGLAMEAEVTVPGTKLRETGPVLITHWGLSGPAVLRLSAWGARALAGQDYRFTVQVNWAPGLHLDAVANLLREARDTHPKRQVAANSLLGMPARLWKRLVQHSGIATEQRWAETGNKVLLRLAENLGAGKFAVTGKSTFKDEFVTAGGVKLAEVNFKTMESKLFPGLFFAGEILNIDAITGGFNFQAAWTTGWIAGKAMGES